MLDGARVQALREVLHEAVDGAGDVGPFQAIAHQREVAQFRQHLGRFRAQLPGLADGGRSDQGGDAGDEAGQGQKHDEDGGRPRHAQLGP